MGFREGPMLLVILRGSNAMCEMLSSKHYFHFTIFKNKQGHIGLSGAPL